MAKSTLHSFYVYFAPYNGVGERTRAKRQLIELDRDDGSVARFFDFVDCHDNQFCGHSCCYLEYICTDCKRWKPVHHGGTDTVLCDDCWVAANIPAAASS